MNLFTKAMEKIIRISKSESIAGISHLKCIFISTSLDIDRAISIAASTLTAGGIIAVPTDTLYGFVTLLSKSDRIYRLKQRNQSKPLGLCLGDIDDIYKLVE
jgi:tRNA A37 threonylcarbamoyladenosine synthetase subunit TsaC/SUA5/YrdC